MIMKRYSGSGGDMPLSMENSDFVDTIFCSGTRY